MKIIKSDWMLVKEAEEKGFATSMTGVVERNRTPLNDELSTYFRQQMPGYYGSFDEDISEDVLFEINEYIEEKDLKRHKIDFPYSEGSDIHLLPITENLQLKILVVDEYHGGGEYSKYIEMSVFIINERTTKTDVDALIAAIKRFTTF